MIELRLHGGIWRNAGDRRQEWQQTLDEINASNAFSVVGDTGDRELSLEIVRLPSGAFLLRLYEDVFERLGEVALESEALDALFSDYAQTIRHMVHVEQDAPVRGFESLDFAKRVVHDEAAAFIESALGEMLAVGSEDARRLFTLLFLIAGDLPERLVRFHRFH